MYFFAEATALAASAEQGSRRQDRVLEEITVSAQRRDENVKDVPIAISVLGGNTLDHSSFTSLNDALRTVPGIAMFENGQLVASTIAIRGVASNPSPLDGASIVGYYWDELSFGLIRSPLTPDLNAYDLERVEVLRGPQGTLYGANSLNGVIRVLTHDADLDEVEFKARTTLSSTQDGGESYRADAALNVPLVPGKLAVRAVVGYADNDGWVDQPQSGRKDVNDEIAKVLRLKVNARPVENFGVELTAWLSRDDRGGSSRSTVPGSSATTGPEPIGNRSDAYGLTLTYDFDAFSVLSATNSIDYSSYSVINVPIAPGNFLITRPRAKLTSQELRFSSTGEGPWKWSAGAIYRDEKDGFFQILSVFSTTSPNDINYKSESFAFFGELTRRFLDNKLELTGGLRYFEDDQSEQELSVWIPSDLIALPLQSRRVKSQATTPRVVLSFRPNESSNYYASYAQGFRSGLTPSQTSLRGSKGLGPNTKPDKLSNYEIGLKRAAFDGRVSYELAAYYIDWKDTVQEVVNQLPPPNETVLYASAVNSEGISGPGVDAAASVRVTDRLDLTATVSWNDLAFDKDVRSTTGLLYLKGDRPPNSSETTAGATIDYALPLWGEYSGQFSAGVNYTSKLLKLAATTGDSIAGDNLLTARSSFTLKAPAGWSAMLFVNNLTNEDGRTQASLADLRNSLGVDRLRPRTYGVQVDYNFK
jgi:outer membrane receptor protein involved in Fe transport